MGGLQGNVGMPKDSEAAAYYWVSEGSAVSQQTVAAGNVPMTPHTIGVYADLTKQLIAQGSYDVQAWIANKLLRNIAQGMDAALISGAGADGQPRGLLYATGIDTPTISTPGTPTYAELLGFLDAIQTDNADVDDMRWALRPNARSKMATTDLSAGAGLPFLDIRSQTAGGYRYVVTNVVPTNGALFGDFSKVILGMWGAIDLNVDRSSLSTTGGIRIVALAMCDVAVTFGEAFAYTARVPA
jgi:HK97 family phage major capsid protein